MDPIESYLGYIQYFKTISESLIGINSFVVGGSERILSRQNSELDYDCLWLEIPDVNLVERGTYKNVFNGAFLLLSNAPPDDWDAEDADLNRLLPLTQQVIGKMIEDSEEGLFEFNPDELLIEWKGKLTGDSDWGWRVEFQITTGACICVDPKMWK
jgi:hypothetical protein